MPGEAPQQFGLTRERIRQIEATALRKLRHPSRSQQLRDFLEYAADRLKVALIAVPATTSVRPPAWRLHDYAGGALGLRHCRFRWWTTTAANGQDVQG